MVGKLNKIKTKNLPWFILHRLRNKLYNLY